MKRFILLCCLLAVALIFGACAADDGPAPAAPADGGAAAPAPAADEPADDENGESLLRNPAWAVPLHVQYAGPQVRDGTDYNDCEMSRYFRDRFNVYWDVVGLTWANWAEMLRIWISAGDMPDMAVWNYVHGEAIAFARDGMVRRMPDDWKERWPYAAAAVEGSVIGPAVAEMFGGYYFLHRPIFAGNQPTDPLLGHHVMYMRRDWMEALGVEVKPTYTMSEIIEIARLIRDNDPGGVGPSLIPLSFNTGQATINFVNRQKAMFDRFYLGDDGYYQWGPANPAVLTGLRLYQEAWRDGLLHPDFFLWTSDEDQQHFRSLGVAGIMSQEGMATFIQSIVNDLTDSGVEDAENALHVAVILGEDGFYHEREVLNFWGSVIFSPNMADEDFERLMYQMDYTAMPETQLMIRMGFEGRDWERYEGGFRMLTAPGVVIGDLYPGSHPLWSNHLILSDDFAIINPIFLPQFRAITNEMYATKARLSTPQTAPRTDWTEFFHDSTSRRMATLAFADMFAELIMMDGDIETNWLNWIETQRPLIDPVLDELNALR